MKTRKVRMEWGNEHSGVRVEVWVPANVALEREVLSNGDRVVHVQNAMGAGMRDMVREVFPWVERELGGEIRVSSWIVGEEE